MKRHPPILRRVRATRCAAAHENSDGEPAAAGHRHPARFPVKTGDISGGGPAPPASAGSSLSVGSRLGIGTKPRRRPNGPAHAQRCQTRGSHRRSLTSASTTRNDCPLTHATCA